MFYVCIRESRQVWMSGKSWCLGLSGFYTYAPQLPCALERTCSILSKPGILCLPANPKALCNSMDVEIVYIICILCNGSASSHGSFGTCEPEAALDSAHVLVRLFCECEGENLSPVSTSNAQALLCRRTVCGKILARCAK